jgi:RNA polymerase sigma-70 factor, ECF subfamily
MGVPAIDRSAKQPEVTSTAKVVRLSRFAGDDRSLVEALRRGDPGATAALYDRYAPHLRRVLARILGLDAELPDLLQEAFVGALSGLGKLRDPERLQAWLTWVAVYTARGCIRRRRRRRWLEFWTPERLDEAPSEDSRREDVDALRRTYRLLEGLGADERIVFSLRYLEQMEVAEVAEACRVSLATAKRRLVRAEKAFAAAAREDPVLNRWVEGSPRWRNR